MQNSIINSLKTNAALNMFLSLCFFTFVNASVKALSSLSFLNLVFYRAIFTMLILAPIIVKLKIPWNFHLKKYLFWRGVFGSFSIFSFFYSLQTLQLATAMSIHYLAPLFTLMLSALFLKEYPRPIQIILFLTSIFGVGLIKNFDTTISPLNFVVAISSSLAAASAYTIIRKISKQIHPFIIMLWFPCITFCIILPFIKFWWVTPEVHQWPLIVSMSISTIFGQFFLTRALQLDQAHKVVGLNYLGLVFSVIIGYGLFNEVPSTMAFIGMAIIMFSVIGIQYTARKKF